MALAFIGPSSLTYARRRPDPAQAGRGKRNLDAVVARIEKGPRHADQYGRLAALGHGKDASEARRRNPC